MSTAEVAAQLPSWVQEASIVAVACISTAIAIWRYVRAETKKDTPSSIKSTEIVAASFTDSKLLKELINTIRESDEEYARISSRILRSQSELRDANIELVEGLKVQSDALLNMTRYITKSTKGNNIDDVI